MRFWITRVACAEHGCRHVQTNGTCQQKEAKAALVANKVAKAVLTNLDISFSLHIGKMVVGSTMNTPYAVEKRRTKETVQAMQQAELGLNGLWKAIIEEENRRRALSTRCQQILDREPYHTPPWVEPSPAKVPVHKLTDLEIGLQAFHLEDQTSIFIPRPTQLKPSPGSR